MATTTSSLLWLGALGGLPALVVVASLFRLELERLRRLAFTAASGLVVVALAPMVTAPLRRLLVATTGGEALLRVNALSSVLLPLAAALWLLTVAVTPRGSLDRGGLRRAALATLTTLASFLTENAVALLLLQAAAVMIFLFALRERADRHQRRVVAAYLGASTILLGGGVAMLLGGRGGAMETAGLSLIAAAALLRKGILPFHAWVPEVFDHGRLGPAILFSAPQVGAYITVVLIVPRAPAMLLHIIAILALATAVYGAALALVEHSARRAIGYLFISQSALVMAGLDCSSATALAGGLLVWLSAGLAFAGLARVVLVLEVRRGRLDLAHYHGGYERTPMLAISFLALGLACTGFPGTLGFIGQELLVRGAVDVFPVMGYAIVVASALTGLAVVRMYFSLFCGRADKPTHRSLRFELKRHEAAAFAALLVVLLGFGLVPSRLVDSQLRASQQILQSRRTSLLPRIARLRRGGQFGGACAPQPRAPINTSVRWAKGRNTKAATAASAAPGPIAGASNKGDAAHNSSKTRIIGKIRRKRGCMLRERKIAAAVKYKRTTIPIAAVVSATATKPSLGAPQSCNERSVPVRCSIKLT